MNSYTLLPTTVSLIGSSQACLPQERSFQSLWLQLSMFVEIVYAMVRGYFLKYLFEIMPRTLKIEHLWWDQATVLRQAGILPSFLPFSDPDADSGGASALLRLPVAGVECVHMLLDESKGRSNEMFGPEWGIKQAQ